MTPDEKTPELMPLVHAAREGRQSAYDEIFQTVIPELRAYVRLHAGQRIRRRESECDIVQSICREVLEDLGQFNGSEEAQFKKWLFTVSLNKIQQKGRFYAAEKRSSSREIDRPADADQADQILDCYKSFCSPSQHLAADEAVRNIEKVFDKLRDDYKLVITLSCFLNLPHVQIATEMGRTEEATRTMLARARAEFAVRLHSTS